MAQKAGDPTPKPVPPKGENFWPDLTQNDVGSFDFGHFQMLIVTLLAVGMYLALAFHSLGLVAATKRVTLPDLDTTVLAGSGSAREHI